MLSIALTTLVVITAAENPNLKTLLFYTCVTPQIGNQCEEGFTLDQAGIVTRGFSSNFSTIEAGKTANISTFFAVHDTFFQNGAGLRKDWKQSWAALQIKLEPLIQSKTVVGFFVGDELFPGKISLEDFKTALQALQVMKTKYPWLVTWENEGGTGWVQSFKKELGGIPDELDIVSCDDYYMWVNNTDTPQSQADGHRAFYEKEIYPLLKPHQKVFLVPGSFGTHESAGPYPPRYPSGNKTYCYDGTFDGCDSYMADQVTAFGEWAMEDQRVAGIAPWHWDTRKIGVVSPYKEVGVVDMPKTKEAWRVIGKAIRASDSSANASDRHQ
jgi:hypothetical protein